MESFKVLDEELFFDYISKKDIINALTLENVENFLQELGVPSQRVKGGLATLTICHNPVDEAVSMKLYYYEDRKIFHCYTECGESMSIFELYKRYMSLNHCDISDDEARYFIAKFLNKAQLMKPDKKKENSFRKKIIPEKQLMTSDEYPIGALDCFIEYYHPLWLKEGITKEVMKNFNIRYSMSQNKIVIPHFDIDGRLIGIRGRALNEEDIKLGKYRPITFCDTIYSHHLGWNLYGIYEHQKAIKKFHRAVIYEAEKSVMLDEVYNGENSCAVAVCGSEFSKNQMALLKKLGVNEIILAFDKEYIDCYSDKGKKYRQKIIDKAKKYSHAASFSYIFDEKNLLDEKDSPVDKGLEIYNQLYKNKIRIR